MTSNFRKSLSSFRLSLHHAAIAPKLNEESRSRSLVTRIARWWGCWRPPHSVGVFTPRAAFFTHHFGPSQPEIRMQLRHLLIALSLSALCPAQSNAQPAVVSQTKNFTITRALATPSGSLQTLASTDLSTTFSAFNQGLGTLTKANLTWGVTQTIEFTVVSGTGGGIGGGGGGGFWLNAINFNGDGGSFSKSLPSGETGTTGFSTNRSFDFLYPWPGNYNPNINALFPGIKRLHRKI